MTNWKNLPHDGRVYFEILDRQLTEQLSSVIDVCTTTKKARLKILRGFSRKLGLRIDSAHGTSNMSKIEYLRCWRKLTTEEIRRVKACATFGERRDQLRKFVAEQQKQASALAGKGRSRRVQLTLDWVAEHDDRLQVRVEIGGSHEIQKQLQSFRWPQADQIVGEFLKRHQVANERIGYRDGHMVLRYARPILNFGWWALSMPVDANKPQPENLEIPGLRRLKHSQFWAKLERLAAKQTAKV